MRVGDRVGVSAGGRGGSAAEDEGVLVVLVSVQIERGSNWEWKRERWLLLVLRLLDL